MLRQNGISVQMTLVPMGLRLIVMRTNDPDDPLSAALSAHTAYLAQDVPLDLHAYAVVIEVAHTIQSGINHEEVFSNDWEPYVFSA